MLKTKNILQYGLLILLTVSCSASKNQSIDNTPINKSNITTTNEINIILFDKKKYDKTKPTQITVYNRKLDIPVRFKEIGVIKAIRKIEIEELKKIAADRGADALLKESSNYIMIRFIDKKEGEYIDIKTI